MVQVTIPILFILMKSEKRAFLHSFFTGILYRICMLNACKKALIPSFFQFHKKKWNFPKIPFFPDFQTMHSLMDSSLHIFRHMLQLWLYESDLEVVQG